MGRNGNARSNYEARNRGIKLCMFFVDIVFFIYLYQRWIYPIDPKRVNEFGLTGEPVDGTEPADPSSQQPEETKPNENGAVNADAEVVSDKKND